MWGTLPSRSHGSMHARWHRSRRTAHVTSSPASYSANAAGHGSMHAAASAPSRSSGRLPPRAAPPGCAARAWEPRRRPAAASRPRGRRPSVVQDEHVGPSFSGSAGGCAVDLPGVVLAADLRDARRLVVRREAWQHERLLDALAAAHNFPDGTDRKAKPWGAARSSRRGARAHPPKLKCLKCLKCRGRPRIRHFWCFQFEAASVYPLPRLT